MKIYIIIGAVLLVGVGLYFLTISSKTYQDWQRGRFIKEGGIVDYAKPFDPKNSTFRIEDREVTLVDGVSEEPAAPSSTNKVVTRYFGNEAYGDLNGDGQDDVAFLVAQEGGGSGLFYYAVVAIKTDTGYKTTNAFLIGDRVSPQSTYIPKNSSELQVNYAERKVGEPMTTQPSVGATLLLKVTPAGVLEGLMR